MTAPARFTQADITRIVKGMSAAGMQVGTIRVAPSGEIVVSVKGQAQDPDDCPNPLDTLLNGA